MTDLPINFQEVLRYMGAANAPEFLQTAQKAAEDLRQALSPKYLYLKFPLVFDQTVPIVGNTGLSLPGNDIRLHLAGCHSCYLLAGTLGAGADRKLRLSSHHSMLYSLALDACATEFIESLLNRAEDAICRAEEQSGRYITSRYSPGYGDLPITLQRQFLALCDAPRKIGLSATEANILTPKKSVTAIIGVSDGPVSGRQRGCQSCRMMEHCTFRKAGTTCANQRLYSN